MLLGIYALAMVSVFLCEIITSKGGWLIFCVAGMVSFITSTIWQNDMTKVKRIILCSVGFVIIATFAVIGITKLEDGSVQVIDYISPFIFILCNSIYSSVKRNSRGANAK